MSLKDHFLPLFPSEELLCLPLPLSKNPPTFLLLFWGALQSYYRDVANHKTLLIPLEQCRLQRTLVFRAVGWVCLNWRFVHSA